MKFPVVMAIVNVTPDSFSDGGLYLEPESAIKRALEAVEAGAQIVDLGAESTRPGAKEVSPEEQKRRLKEVISAIKRHSDVLISVDTRSADVAAWALKQGAGMINDVSGFKHDPEMVKVLAKFQPFAVAMHMRGTPEDMRDRAHYHDLLWEIAGELLESARLASRAGFDLDRLWFDPGIGFAKTAQQSAEVAANIRFFKSLGRPLVIGPSRKSFLGAITGKERPVDRVWATAAAVAIAVFEGADCVRVHDVAEMTDVVKVASRLREVRRA